MARIALRGDPPGWLEPTLASMAELLELPKNWSSYAALPIDPAQVAWALDLLARTMGSNTPAPTLVPTSAGGIELEWHTRGMDIEVHPIRPGGVYFYCEDQLRGAEQEQELEADLSPLGATLAELARRS